MLLEQFIKVLLQEFLKEPLVDLIWSFWSILPKLSLETFPEIFQENHLEINLKKILILSRYFSKSFFQEIIPRVYFNVNGRSICATSVWRRRGLIFLNSSIDFCIFFFTDFFKKIKQIIYGLFHKVILEYVQKFLQSLLQTFYKSYFEN